MSKEEGVEQGVELTRREKEVLRLLTDGDDTRTIAAELSLSPKTVEMHLSKIYQKLGVKGRVQAVLRYLGQHGNG